MIRSAETVLPSEVAGHYDELDPFYRALWGEHVHHGYWSTGAEAPNKAAEGLIELLAQRMKLQDGMRVCDVGCGYGATAEFLSRRLGCEVTGITLSRIQAMRAQHRAAADPRLTFIGGNWLENQLPDESFDALVAIESTEHMEDKRLALTEMLRVLTPGGKLGICAWLVSEKARDWEVRHLLEPICREGRLPSMLTERELTTFAVEAGFGGIEFVDLSRSVRRTWEICARRLAWSVVISGDVRRFLSNQQSRNRIFPLTLVRIVLAYRIGSMRYGILTARRRT